MTMDVKNTVLTKLTDHVSEQISSSNIDINASLKELEIDSLAVLQIIFELEEHFSIVIDESELSQIETIGDLICAVDKSLKSAA